MPNWNEKGAAEWKLSAEKFQEDVGSQFCSRIWEPYLENEVHRLKFKVGYALFGPASRQPDEGKEDFSAYKEEEIKYIEKLVEIIKKLSVKSGCKVILFAVLFVSGKQGDKMFQEAVFRICKDQNGSLTKVCFIDSKGRVYDGWKNYLEDNQLPECLCIYPQDGVYELDENENIKLGYGESPACRVSKKVGTVVDVGTAITATVTTAIGLLSFFPPTAPIFLPAAGVCLWAGTTAGVVGAVRSTTTLIDKGKHEESINPLNDREAFASWMSVLGGSIGASSGLAVRSVSDMAARGAVLGKLGRVAVTALNISSLSVNGIGVLSGFYFLADKIDKHGLKSVTPLEVYQLTTSVFFFSNALMKPKTASGIIKEVQTKVLQDFKNNLQSDKAKEGFDLLLEKTAKGGRMKSNAVLIRGVQHIDNHEEFFASLSDAAGELSNKNLQFTELGQLKVDGNSAKILSKKDTQSQKSSPQKSSANNHKSDTSKTSEKKGSQSLDDDKKDSLRTKDGDLKKASGDKRKNSEISYETNEQNQKDGKGKPTPNANTEKQKPKHQVEKTESSRNGNSEKGNLGTYEKQQTKQSHTTQEQQTEKSQASVKQKTGQRQASEKLQTEQASEKQQNGHASEKLQGGQASEKLEGGQASEKLRDGKASEKQQTGKPQAPDNQQTGKPQASEKQQNGHAPEKQQGGQASEKLQDGKASEKQQTGKPQAPEKQQTGKPQAPEKQQTGKPQASEKQQTGKSQVPEKQQTGKPQAPAKQQTGKPQAPEKQQTGKSHLPEKQQTGKPQASEKQQTGKPQAPEKQQTGKPQAPEKQQTGKSQVPEKQQTGKHQAPEKQQTGKPQASGKQQTGKPQASEKQQIGQPSEKQQTGQAYDKQQTGQAYDKQQTGQAYNKQHKGQASEKQQTGQASEKQQTGQATGKHQTGQASEGQNFRNPRASEKQQIEYASGKHQSRQAFENQQTGKGSENKQIGVPQASGKQQNGQVFQKQQNIPASDKQQTRSSCPIHLKSKTLENQNHLGSKKLDEHQILISNKEDTHLGSKKLETFQIRLSNKNSLLRNKKLDTFQIRLSNKNSLLRNKKLDTFQVRLSNKNSLLRSKKLDTFQIRLSNKNSLLRSKKLDTFQIRISNKEDRHLGSPVLQTPQTLISNIEDRHFGRNNGHIFMKQQGGQASAKLQNGKPNENEQTEKPHASEEEQTGQKSEKKQHEQPSGEQHTGQAYDRQQTGQASEKQKGRQASEKHQIGQGFEKQQSGQASEKQQTGQPSEKQQCGDASVKQQNSQGTEKQHTGKASERQQNGQVSEKQQSGQASEKQQNGQASEKQQNGQASGKQQTGQASGKQQSGKAFEKQQRGQASEKQNGSLKHPKASPDEKPFLRSTQQISTLYLHLQQGYILAGKVRQAAKAINDLQLSDNETSFDKFNTFVCISSPLYTETLRSIMSGASLLDDVETLHQGVKVTKYSMMVEPKVTKLLTGFRILTGATNSLKNIWNGIRQLQEDKSRIIPEAIPILQEMTSLFGDVEEMVNMLQNRGETVATGSQLTQLASKIEQGGQASEKQNEPQASEKQNKPQASEKQNKPQASEKQHTEQADDKQQFGQASEKQQSGQASEKQQSGQASEKQQGGQESGKQQTGQASEKQKGSLKHSIAGPDEKPFLKSTQQIATLLQHLQQELVHAEGIKQAVKAINNLQLSDDETSFDKFNTFVCISSPLYTETLESIMSGASLLDDVETLCQGVAVTKYSMMVEPKVTKLLTGFRILKCVTNFLNNIWNGIRRLQEDKSRIISEAIPILQEMTSLFGEVEEMVNMLQKRGETVAARSQLTQQASENQQSGRASEKQKGGQASEKQQTGQPSEKQQCGQASKKQQSGHASVKQQKPQGTKKQRAGKASKRQRPGQTSKKQQSGQASKKQQGRHKPGKHQTGKASEKQKGSSKHPIAGPDEKSFLRSTQQIVKLLLHLLQGYVLAGKVWQAVKHINDLEFSHDETFFDKFKTFVSMFSPLFKESLQSITLGASLLDDVENLRQGVNVTKYAMMVEPKVTQLHAAFEILTCGTNSLENIWNGIRGLKEGNTISEAMSILQEMKSLFSNVGEMMNMLQKHEETVALEP